MAKEMDYEDKVVSMKVEDGAIDRVISGKTTHITLDISESNYRMILKNADGNLLLNVEKLPKTFHGCYYYNEGVFPYVIQDGLEFIMLHNEDETLLTRVIGYEAEPHTRFRFQGPGKPSIEDPKGDSCIWAIHFEVVPLKEDLRSYLMRWNPTISSFTEAEYRECVANAEHGKFRMNWSIYDWQEARRGDMFYMMRTGDDKAGIVFSGQFISDPYPEEDWAGSNKRRMYVDMVVCDFEDPGAAPRISLEKLQAAIPSFEWSKGHSGVMLSEEETDKLVELLDEK